MKKYITLGAIACLFPAAGLAQEKVFETPYWTKAPVIEVLGRANLEVPPNRASFSISFVETDRDANDAMKLAVERGRAAYNAIKAVAGDSSRVHTSVSVDPYYEQYRDKDGDRIENRRADKVKGYEARVAVSVTVTDVARAGSARAAALALGPEDSSSLRVYLERTADLNRQAYEAAVADAAARARMSASAAGTTLGRLMVIQEGNGPCLGRWTTQPGIVAQKSQYARAVPAPAMETRRERVVVTGTKIGGRDIVITQADIDALDLPSDETPQNVQSSVCAIYSVGG